MVIIWVIQWVLGLFILIPVWILGVIEVFTWADDKLYSFPMIIRYPIAGLLAFISFFMVFISWPIGIFRFAELSEAHQNKKGVLGKLVDNFLSKKCLTWFVIAVIAVILLVRLSMGSVKAGVVLLTALILAPFSIFPHRDTTDKSSESEAKEGIHYSSSFSSEQATHATPPSQATRLVDIGLAHIGRITKSPNPLLTPSQTAARRNAERPFIRLLADRCRDENTRKALSRYFMVYKEMTLFVIYAQELRQNPALHIDIRTKLKERLSEGLLPDVLKKRNALWREMSEKFYESITRTHDLSGTLEYAFWSKLPDRLKADGTIGGKQLREIYEYSRAAIAKALEA